MVWSFLNFSLRLHSVSVTTLVVIVCAFTLASNSFILFSRSYLFFSRRLSLLLKLSIVSFLRAIAGTDFEESIASPWLRLAERVLCIK